MNFLILTKSTTFIIGPIATLLGYIMEGIYTLGVHNVSACIIIFTVVVNLILLPLTIKQQKFTKINSAMQPEINAITKKYEGKEDQASLNKRNAETQAVYDKYGTSPTGGCLVTLIQLPILFALYQVIYRIPAYIPQIKAILMNIVEPVMEQEDYINKIAELAEDYNLAIDSYDYTDVNRMVDLFGKFTSDSWAELQSIFPELSTVIEEYSAEFLKVNSFIGGMNLTESPGFKLSIALIIPILAGLSQWISVKLTSAGTVDDGSPTASSMKTMNTIMPLISVFFCITLPIGIGIYWVASSVVRTILQLGINQYMKHISVDDLVKKNIEKQNKKRARKGQKQINADATVKSMNKAAEIAERNKKLEEERKNKTTDTSASTEYYRQKTEGMGTIASRARMVQDYDEKKGTKKKK